MGKSLLASKTFWVSVLMFITTTIPAFNDTLGAHVPWLKENLVAVYTAAVIVLRYITKDPIVGILPRKR